MCMAAGATGLIFGRNMWQRKWDDAIAIGTQVHGVWRGMELRSGSAFSIVILSESEGPAVYCIEPRKSSFLTSLGMTKLLVGKVL